MSLELAKIQVAIGCSTGRTAPGELEIETYSSGTLVARALVRGFVGLLITGLMVFVPLAHFVLVPLGMVITIFLAAAALSNKQRILAGGGACPECGAQIKIMPRPNRVPFNDICESCGRRVTVDRPQPQNIGH